MMPSVRDRIFIIYIEIGLFRSCRKFYLTNFFYDEAVAQWTAYTLNWEDSSTQLLMELLPPIMTPVCLPYATT